MVPSVDVLGLNGAGQENPENLAEKEKGGHDLVALFL